MLIKFNKNDIRFYENSFVNCKIRTTFELPNLSVKVLVGKRDLFCPRVSGFTITNILTNLFNRNNVNRKSKSA